jgi:glycosyltransferase involved in cell wall biosynthesis
LRILSLSDLSSTGGAAIAGNRISDALKTRGADVIQLSSDGSNTKDQRALFNGKKFSAFHDLLSPFVHASKANSLRDNNLNHQFRKFLKHEKFDVINTHNLHSAGWPISLVFTALEYAPVVWTLHDCWSFLGSFYPSHCPASSDSLKLELKSFWRSIECGPTKHTLTAVTPSDWMNKIASSSLWSDCTVQTIHNPVPKSFFEALDRESCKKSLGLALEKPTVLCVAGNLNEERKGGPILKEMLELGSKDQFQLLLIGEGNQFNDSKIKSLGFIKDEITLRIAYHAADVLLHPALVDNLPNTVAESMSCGTPVLGFNVGGLPEMVSQDKSGWLVEEINTTAMTKKLNSVLQSKQAYDLRQSTKETAESLFNEKKVADDYFKAFKNSLSK